MLVLVFVSHSHHMFTKPYQHSLFDSISIEGNTPSHISITYIFDSKTEGNNFNRGGRSRILHSPFTSDAASVPHSADRHRKWSPNRPPALCSGMTSAVQSFGQRIACELYGIFQLIETLTTVNVRFVTLTWQCMCGCLRPCACD